MSDSPRVEIFVKVLSKIEIKCQGFFNNRKYSHWKCSCDRDNDVEGERWQGP